MRTDLTRRKELLGHVRDVLITDLRLDVDPDQIDPDVSLYGTGLGLDSVDAIDLAVGVQKRTGVRIPDGARGHVALRSVNALVDLLMELGDG
ncbi:MAG: acyl carrier protein [Proteobacteria bacterium]|nr:acyl carrier protein [Pseudomonadota bacterium]MCP4922341.1 acyl carrier protein [Pseudomonadota bacterium]